MTIQHDFVSRKENSETIHTLLVFVIGHRFWLKNLHFSSFFLTARWGSLDFNRCNGAAPTLTHLSHTHIPLLNFTPAFPPLLSPDAMERTWPSPNHQPRLWSEPPNEMPETKPEWNARTNVRICQNFCHGGVHHGSSEVWCNSIDKRRYQIGVVFEPSDSISLWWLSPLILLGHHPKFLGEPWVSESATARALYSQTVGDVKLCPSQDPQEFPDILVATQCGLWVCPKTVAKKTGMMAV